MSIKNAKLYFLALVPPDTVFQKVQRLKEEVADKYESKASLKSPPHITLHMPFKYREDRESQIFKLISEISKDQYPFTVKQNGFGSFPPRVIYVNVEKSDSMEKMRNDLVKKMKQNLKLENADYKGKPFHPHMTIAFRDLKKRIFPEAWKNYENQDFHEAWECNSISLLKHNGKSWDLYKSFTFQT